MARALAVGIAKIEKDPRYDQIQRSTRHIQLERALDLHQAANVPLRSCGLNEVKLFQQHLINYQIIVVSGEHNNAIIYPPNPPGTDEKPILSLYYHNNHFDTINSLPGFLSKNYFCHRCHKSYSNTADHVCPAMCGSCRHFGCVLQGDGIVCNECDRVFKNQACYDHHKEPMNGGGRSVCEVIRKCPKCGRAMDVRKIKDGGHMCGKKCSTCGVILEPKDTDHLCYIQQLEQEEERSYKRLLFFDFEATQEHGIHHPNLCVVYDEDKEVKLFQGEDTVKEFCQWLLTPEHKSCIVIAHNFQGYDSYFIIKFLNENAIHYEIIYRGAKCLSMTIPMFNIRFIDSLNFIPMGLAKFPKTFAQPELCKGYFPHLFNKDANQNYVGPIPCQDDYGVNFMKPAEREAFIAWHQEQVENVIVSNYRPISLLSIFNKILEKLIYKRLLHFLEQNHVLFDGQFGFRANLSTTHAILLITDKIQRAIENKLYSCGIFLDLSKAFDTVNHSILLKKLEKYGVRGVANDWFCSYLSNRRQFVSIGNSVSECKPITCGVPQGSVLGPLLFLLYINDFNKCAPSIDFHLYADDSNLFCSHKSLQVLETTLNDQLNSINEWLCANKLSLNVDKSNFVIFHPPQKSPIYSINLKIHDKVIMQKRSIKYLGVLIDTSLNWKDHIHELSKKISRGIGILLKLRKCVSTQILLQVYYSIIYTFFTYGVLIWGNTYKTNLYPLIILQKKAVRIITFSDFLAHTSPLFKELNLLKFIDIVDFHTALFMFRYSRGNLPGNFDGYFNLVCNTHLYGTRAASKTTFSLPLTRTNYGLFNIRFCGPKVWNTIDESFKSLSMTCLKKKFKNQIIGLY